VLAYPSPGLSCELSLIAVAAVEVAVAVEAAVIARASPTTNLCFPDVLKKGALSPLFFDHTLLGLCLTHPSSSLIQVSSRTTISDRCQQ
jgi:hypothetical protein